MNKIIIVHSGFLMYSFVFSGIFPILFGANYYN